MIYRLKLLLVCLAWLFTSGCYVEYLIYEYFQEDDDKPVAASAAPTEPPPNKFIPVSKAGSDLQRQLSDGELTLDGSASTDGDGQTLTYLWAITTSPTGSTASLATTATATTKFTPDLVGIYIVKLTVSDGTYSASDEVSVDVAENLAATAAAGSDQTTNTAGLITLDGSGSSGGGALTYEWTQINGPDVTGGSGTLSGVAPSFTAPSSVSTIVFRLRINDGAGWSFTDEITINIFEDATKTMFVDLTNGLDTNSGSQGAPRKTIQSAIDAAVATGSDIYVLSGKYNETITLQSGVSIYGGYRDQWVRDTADNPTVVSGSTKAIIGNSISNLTIDGIKIESANATVAGSSSYGVFLTSVTNVSLTNSTITAGNGASGTTGTSGTTGSNGSTGGNGVSGSCNSNVTATGGTAGSGGGSAGGAGGAGGYNTASGSGGVAGSGAGGGSLGLGGSSGNPGNDGSNGGTGANGTSGTNGTGGASLGSFAVAGYTAANNGINGASGANGNGGGGGGGGGGQAVMMGHMDADGTGNGGGGGGSGGTGGTAGNGGTGGGASIALFMNNSTVTLTNNTFKTGNAGNGGTGGTGATGGSGGAGGLGATTCSTEVGAGGNGGSGGSGGSGGNGGGGGGGPVYGLVYDGASSVTASGNNFTLGSAGTGGIATNSGSTGSSANTYVY